MFDAITFGGTIGSLYLYSTYDSILTVASFRVEKLSKSLILNQFILN